jgi:adenine phosphoribosyltransferase
LNSLMDLKHFIREVPNWPIKGMIFYDITTLLQVPEIFKNTVDAMIEPFKDVKIDRVAAIEARGFLLGAPIAYKIACGVSLVRKDGKLPYKTIKESYGKEYGMDALTMHEDTIQKGEKVLVVDDLIATGGTMEATIKMVERLGGEVVGITVIVDLPFLGGSKKLIKYKQNCLVSYDEE